MQGARIQLSSASLDWAKGTLKSLQAAQRAAGAFSAVIVETVGPELLARAPEDTREITFEPGAPVTLTRDTKQAFTSATVPVFCEAAFTSLQLKRDAVLQISTYLAAGALRRDAYVARVAPVRRHVALVRRRVAPVWPA